MYLRSRANRSHGRRDVASGATYIRVLPLRSLSALRVFPFKRPTVITELCASDRVERARHAPATVKVGRYCDSKNTQIRYHRGRHLRPKRSMDTTNKSKENLTKKKKGALTKYHICVHRGSLRLTETDRARMALEPARREALVPPWPF